MKGVQEVFNLKVGEEKTLGSATISCYEFSKKKDPLYNMRVFLDGDGMMYMRDGEYIRLVVNGNLEMSDTNMEKNSNWSFVNNAKGDVFIAGLGIGLILHNLRDKIKSGEVTSVTVLEKSQDVIDLVAPYYKDLGIKVIQGDIREYKPQKEEKYDTIYFDIWPTINEDNLEEIATFHQRWKFHKRKGGWMSSWMQDTLRRRKANERRQVNFW